MSTFIFHAGIAVRQTFETLLSSTISHWGCLWWFSSRAVTRCGSAD